MKNITQYRSFISQIEKLKAVDFNLPTELEANRPPEERGLKRDEVKLMVSYTKDNKVIHDRFFNLDNYIESGDLIVVNTSKTMCSSVDATRGNGQKMKLHLSTHLPSDLWIVEMRTIDGNTTKPFYDLEEGEVLVYLMEELLLFINIIITDFLNKIIKVKDYGLLLLTYRSL